MYCILYTVYCILCTEFCVLYTLYSVLYNVYCILSIVYCVLHTVYSILCTAYCVLKTVYFIMCTVYFKLCTVNCVLYTVVLLLNTVYRVQCTVYCSLCTLYFYYLWEESGKHKDETRFELFPSLYHSEMKYVVNIIRKISWKFYLTKRTKKGVNPRFKYSTCRHHLKQPYVYGFYGWAEVAIIFSLLKTLFTMIKNFIYYSKKLYILW